MGRGTPMEKEDPIGKEEYRPVNLFKLIHFKLHHLNYRGTTLLQNYLP